ncbi:inactive glucose-1-phosphate adenylyltransferase small subunit 2, chloroplastic isoform X2 [Euphorbia lathyris]|uniref:inactive glucose-1-phosphate adenylyltransferase small subunit 2, chloroplastic isoform X2 n=1 Tax=Euphorbia lathyris TaxID=212925 RepID=UPI003313319B
MVILQLPLQTNLSIPQKHSSKLPSSSSWFRRLFVSNSHYPISLSSPVNQSVAAIVFGDGSESRLYPLTKRRSEGAIPIAGNYRLIDGVISNCINSNINKIYAITQFNSTSLNSHLSRAYNGIGIGKEGFLQVIAAYQSPEHQAWFQGTADAMRRCLWVLEEYPVTEFLVLPGHHLYKMDYQKLIEAHRNSQADITIAALNYARDPDPGFGLLKVNLQNEVAEFSLITSVKSPRNLKDSCYSTYSSMGIYVVNREIMTKLLNKYFPEANDFGSEVIPGAVSAGMKVEAYSFEGYWEEMRNIGALYEANMECIKRRNMGYNFYDKDYPLYTLPRYLPPTIINDAVITDCAIADGCILNSCKIKGSIVGIGTRIGDRAVIEDSVIMGSDTFYLKFV